MKTFSVFNLLSYENSTTAEPDRRLSKRAGNFAPENCATISIVIHVHWRRSGLMLIKECVGDLSRFDRSGICLKLFRKCNFSKSSILWNYFRHQPTVVSLRINNFFCVFIFSSLETQIFGKFISKHFARLRHKTLTAHSVNLDEKLLPDMETRSRTTKLIVKNVEMLESSKFDKFDKVSEWLDKLAPNFEFQQHQNHSHISTTSNQQNSTSRINQDKNDDFFDSDSSVNTGKNFFFLRRLFFFVWWHFQFPFLLLPARYILTNRKNKRKSSTQCRSKIKKFRDNDVQFEQYDLDELDTPGHKLKRLKIDSNTNVKFCAAPVQKMNVNEINFNGT